MNGYTAESYDENTFAVYDNDGNVESYGYFTISEAQERAEELNAN
jgi:hypothetical protein